MITAIILFTSAICVTATTDNITQYQSNNIKRYLYDYGFLQVKDEMSLQVINESELGNALLIFQEYYKLPADGKLNNETLELIQKPRCGNADIISNFHLTTFKWNKTQVLWHYYLANQQVIELTKKAFDLWEQSSGIRFKHDRTNPDILISNKNLKHKMQMNNSEQCMDLFDGKGGILAHAYYPDRNNTLREIHIDNDEDWSYSTNNNISSDQISLLSTLIHEIGHALGLKHSEVSDSIMYSYYNGKIKLSDDDILGIQNLYGKPQTAFEIPLPPPLPTPTPFPSSSSEDEHPVDTNQIDLCHFKNLKTFLIANKRIYILHDKWLWIININEKKYSKPLVITDRLTFLPKNFTKILGVYQRPSGEIVMLINSLIYMFDLTNLRLSYGYPRHIQTVFNISPNEVHSIFNSYTGKTYIFHNDNYYREVDESTFTIKSWGYISDAFPGIPPKIDSSFRYIDGNLYFFKNDMLYVFNEFTGELIKTEKNNLAVFGLKCINDDILYKLKDLISELLIQRQNK